MTDLDNVGGMFQHNLTWGCLEEVALGSGMAESIPSSLSRSSALVEGRVPKAADGSSLLGMLC